MAQKHSVLSSRLTIVKLSIPPKPFSLLGRLDHQLNLPCALDQANSYQGPDDFILRDCAQCTHCARDEANSHKKESYDPNIRPIWNVQIAPQMRCSWNWHQTQGTRHALAARAILFIYKRRKIRRRNREKRSDFPTVTVLPLWTKP